MPRRKRPELRQVERGPVPDLIVRVEQRSSEKNNDAVAQAVTLEPEPSQGRQGRRTHRRILQDHPVIDDPDVPGRVLCFRTLLAEQVQYLDTQERKLAVLDELGQLIQRDVLRLRDVPDDGQDGVHDRLFVREPAILPQAHAQEAEHAPVLGRELDAQRPDRLDDHNLELIGQLADKVANLLHQPVDGTLISGLEQCCDREGGDGPVAICDERLHLDVSGSSQGSRKTASAPRGPPAPCLQSPAPRNARARAVHTATGRSPW